MGKITRSVWLSWSHTVWRSFCESENPLKQRFQPNEPFYHQLICIYSLVTAERGQDGVRDEANEDDEKKWGWWKEVKVNTMLSVNKSNVVPERSPANKRAASVDYCFSPPPPSLSTLSDVHPKKGRRSVNINWTRVAVPQGSRWPH